MDKTGTVTNGKPVLTDVYVADGVDEENVPYHSSDATEKQSEHPLAEAIVQGINDRGIALLEVRDFEAIPGYGVRGLVRPKRNFSWHSKINANKRISILQMYLLRWKCWRQTAKQRC